jgi:hypothetical protein
MRAAFIACFIFVLMLVGIWMEINIWNECRETNSFWYCMRVLSK